MPHPPRAIEQAWLSYRRAFAPPDTPVEAVEFLRQAFYSGAAVLFQAIMQGLDAGDEATDADLERMTAINNELAEFGAELDRKHGFRVN